MSTTITTAFVRQYETEVHHLFQRMGGLLRTAVRAKSNVVGESTTFQKIGTGAASTKARHGVITPMNVEHTNVTCTIADFYAGDWVDRLDEAKVNIDERMALAQAGAWALGRKVDDQILTAMDGTSQSTVTLSLTSKGAAETSFLEWVRKLDLNDVPNDGYRYAVVTPFAWSLLMKINSFAVSDYVNYEGLPFKEGASIMKWKDWLGVKWCVHNGISGVGTATAKCMMWHKRAVGYASGAHPMNAAEQTNAIMADITWHGDRASHFVNHWMSGGACLIEDNGVIEANINDTGTIPESAT